MKSVFKTKKTKFGIDLAMILGLIGCAISTSAFEEIKRAAGRGANPGEIFHWGTSHCIISIILVAIIFIHIWQHWDYIKAVITKKLYMKNKISTLTLILFLATVISFMLYLNGFTFINLHFHSIMAHLFVVLAIVHLLMNWRKLLLLVRKKSCQEKL